MIVLRKTNKELNLKLRVPRLHMEFLEEKGSLDHFVQAKLLGQEETAKWSLLKAGKAEITAI